MFSVTYDVNTYMSVMKEIKTSRKGENLFCDELLIVKGRDMIKLGIIEVGGTAAESSLTRNPARGKSCYRGGMLS